MKKRNMFWGPFLMVGVALCTTSCSDDDATPIQQFDYPEVPALTVAEGDFRASDEVKTLELEEDGLLYPIFDDGKYRYTIQYAEGELRLRRYNMQKVGENEYWFRNQAINDYYAGLSDIGPCEDVTDNECFSRYTEIFMFNNGLGFNYYVWPYLAPTYDCYFHDAAEQGHGYIAVISWDIVGYGADQDKKQNIDMFISNYTPATESQSAHITLQYKIGFTVKNLTEV